MAYSHDSYHDDPIELKPRKSKQKISPIFALVLLLVSGGFFLQTTLASNISLSSSASVEFGQGILQSTACSGESQLTLTPVAEFTNIAGAGAHKFSSLTVSGIPDGCWGSDFTISAYGASDNAPLALFNSTSSRAVIYDDGGTFQVGTGGTGMSVTSGSGSFTVTFTSPVALSSSVSRVTIQSGAHISLLCAEGGICIPGDRGPGGGFVYYVSANYFTSTGSACNTTCKYLEVAPSGWNGGSDVTKKWATGTSSTGNAVTDITGIANDSSANNSSAKVGYGYRNTLAIINMGNDSTTVGGEIFAYRGGSKDDWYLPTTAELNLLCQWARGVAPSVTTACSGGTLNSPIYGAGAAGFVILQNYFSSSEHVNTNVWSQSFYDGAQSSTAKLNLRNYRPVRAF
jgi:hypothetical protein